MKHWERSRNIGEAFSFAWRGLQDVFLREQNVRIQLLVGTLVVCAMFFYRIPPANMAIGIMAIVFVVALEMINTSLELFADAMYPEYNSNIRSAKDIAAGAVLLASIGACIVGVLVFL